MSQIQANPECQFGWHKQGGPKGLISRSTYFYDSMTNRKQSIIQHLHSRTTTGKDKVNRQVFPQEISVKDQRAYH